ncbi:MAG: PIN domain-containing protein [Clostridium sp.]|uniref:type II toxin-antitoxin system VapC family toxin n=1 Tax=Clostridium culturomicium TaxID=1499683 RepID=UPI00058F68AA|nr:PIN domain-containing protein [Clostridium culturomicium]MDU4892305.1 PIN domain-containing protein [Clostridium sp.]MDU7085679.1 PIN domain-containing protein [Clostridium sp.]
MEILIYPFNSIDFNSNTTILLDASFLLSLVYDDDIHHAECIEVFRILINKKTKLFITNIISAEVLNQIMYRVFMLDIRHKMDKRNPFNSQTNIKDIISSFSKYDKKIIKDKRIDKLREIPYKKYFDNISKNTKKRDLLSIYYKTAVAMHNQLENTVKYSYVDINKQCMIKTKELMVKNMLSINDATHLASCICNNIEYLLTLDSDFIYADCDSVKVLKI